MYRSVLLILYLVILTLALTRLIRYRDVPSSRRLSAGLGIGGMLLAPTAAGFLYELMASVLSIGLFLLIFLGGIGLILKSVFR